MAKKSMIAKANRKPKFEVRGYHRCFVCGRPRAYMRRFALCRICFREMATRGQVVLKMAHHRPSVASSPD